MDDIVVRAMQKWPAVPRVYGWLRLDRRGQWRVKDRAGSFGRISNRAVVDFIGRNYAVDERGRWFFQNGPQRVFVTLEYTPWIYRLGDGEWLTHTGEPAAPLEALYVDEAGALLARTAAGIGLVDDRDLHAVIARLEAENPALADDALAGMADRVQPLGVRLFGRALELAGVRSGEVAARFGFDPAPVPPPGESEC